MSAVEIIDTWATGASRFDESVTLLISDPRDEMVEVIAEWAKDGAVRFLAEPTPRYNEDEREAIEKAARREIERQMEAAWDRAQEAALDAPSAAEQRETSARIARELK